MPKLSTSTGQGSQPPPPTTEAQCEAYLKSLNIPDNLLSSAKLLLRPLSRELVKDALDRLNKQSAPGKDGFSTNIYLAFQDQFVDHMHDLVQEAFREGKLPNGWELGLINCIPKTAGPAAIDKLRPIALQDIKKKWFMTIIMCMVEDVITHRTHPQQMGCIKGRKMIRHIWGAKGGYDNMSSGIMISFDYSNAFPSLSHPFIRAALNLINLPDFIINVIMSTLVSPLSLLHWEGG